MIMEAYRSDCGAKRWLWKHIVVDVEQMEAYRNDDYGNISMIMEAYRSGCGTKRWLWKHFVVDVGQNDDYGSIS